MAEVTGWRTVGVKMADYTKSTEMEWVNKAESAQSQSTLFDA